jgi:hypothetical protein
VDRLEESVDASPRNVKTGWISQASARVSDTLAPRWKVVSVALLSFLVAGTIAAGILFHHYFLVLLFSLWLSAEVILWRYQGGWQRFNGGQRSRLHSLGSLLNLYGKFDTVSDRVVEEKIAELNRTGSFSEAEMRWLSRLRDLVALRRLVLSHPEKGKSGLRQGFRFRHDLGQVTDKLSQIESEVSLQDVTESATLVADLYWKLFDTALGGYAELTNRARELYEQIFGQPFDPVTARPIVAKLTDSMQRDRGLPFLILNLVSHGDWKKGRLLAQRLLT